MNLEGVVRESRVVGEIIFVKHQKIPVACIQIRAHDREDFERSWPHIVSLIDTAAERGARLIVLPEATVPAYVLGNEPVPPEQLARTANDIAVLARRYAATIVYGGVKLEAGRTFNAAIAIGSDGDELGYAAKQFLWHFDRRWFAPGATLEPIDTPVGRLGLLVCADGRIPTIAATLVERGAQLLVMPTAWVTSGRDPRTLENLQADLMANVRARENGVPFAVANKCGVELESVAYCGKSALIESDGAFVARASEREEEIVSGELTLARGRTFASSVTFESAPAPEAPSRTSRLRIAFTTASGADVQRFVPRAALADADLILARSPRASAMPGACAVLDVAPVPATLYAHGVALTSVDSQAFLSPRGLVAERLGGCDLFVWHADDDSTWSVAFARTRAAELRAYVVVFAAGRAFAVDPDGAVVAGTFDDFALATFVYDRTRAAATQVAPSTDVLLGLREAERIRALVAQPVDVSA
jgi:predicted amidohydrolase